jgi:uncharacterized membrane protein YfcA
MIDSFSMLAYVATFLAGLVLGMLGGGGSILTLPILIFLFGKSADQATTYSLFAVGTVAAVSLVVYWKRGLVHLEQAAKLSAPIIVGVLVSRMIVMPTIPLVIDVGFVVKRADMVLLLLTIAIFWAAWAMLKKSGAKFESTVSVSTTKIIFLGLGCGLFMGVIGAGGGFLVVPIFVRMMNLDMRQAVGSSLFVIVVSTLSGFFGDVVQGVEFDGTFLAIFTCVMMAGASIGTYASNYVSTIFLRKSFAILLLFLGFYLLWKVFSIVSPYI